MLWVQYLFFPISPSYRQHEEKKKKQLFLLRIYHSFLPKVCCHCCIAKPQKRHFNVPYHTHKAKGECEYVDKLRDILVPETNYSENNFKGKQFRSA